MEFSEFIKLDDKNSNGQMVTLVETSNGIQPFPIVLHILKQLKKLEQKVTYILLGSGGHAEKYLADDEIINCSELVRDAADFESFLEKFVETISNIPGERVIAFDDISVLTSLGLSCYEAVLIIHRLIWKNRLRKIIFGSTIVSDDQENSLFLGHLRTFCDSHLVGRALSSGKCKEITGTVKL